MRWVPHWDACYFLAQHHVVLTGVSLLLHRSVQQQWELNAAIQVCTSSLHLHDCTMMKYEIYICTICILSVCIICIYYNIIYNNNIG